MNERVLLIRTGGTIDAEPYADPKHPPQYVSTLKDADSLIMPTIAQLPNHKNVDGFSWGAWQENRFVKDSQLFTEEDINALASIIKNDTHNMFIITHGTDAMTKNALLLQEKLAGCNKTIVFAGAMVPLSMHTKHNSDGIDSLRFALEHIQPKSAGVYVVGRDSHTKRLEFFNPADVEKDRDASLASSQFTLKPTQRG